MTQPDTTCRCTHLLSEHQRESLLCGIFGCPCEQFEDAEHIITSHEHLHQNENGKYICNECHGLWHSRESIATSSHCLERQMML